MLRQSRVRASRASPAEKLQGLRVVCSKNFSRAVFWSTQMVDIYLSYLPDCETNLMKKLSVSNILNRTKGSCAEFNCLGTWLRTTSFGDGDYGLLTIAYGLEKYSKTMLLSNNLVFTA